MTAEGWSDARDVAPGDEEERRQANREALAHARSFGANVARAQQEADSQRRLRRREQWEPERLRLHLAWLKAKREAEESGRVLVADPPGHEPPAWFYASDPSPRTIIEPPAEPEGPQLAPGRDELGRTFAPALTAEQQFAATAKGKRRRFGR